MTSTAAESEFVAFVGCFRSKLMQLQQCFVNLMSKKLEIVEQGSKFDSAAAWCSSFRLTGSKTKASQPLEEELQSNYFGLTLEVHLVVNLGHFHHPV